MISNKLNTILNFWGIVYLLGILTAYIYSYKESIPVYALFMQTFIFFTYYFMLKFSSKVFDITNLLYAILINFIIFTFVIRYIFWEYTGKPYGNFSSDAYGYEAFALRFIDKNFGALINAILQPGGLNVDDLGYTSVIYIVNSWYHNLNWARNFILIINSITIVYSSYFLYKLCILLRIEDRTALFVSAIYGFFPFFCVSSAVGLKENIFCLLITGALYYMYKYKEEKKSFALFAAISFILSTFFFRSVITLMLCFSFLFLLYCNEKNRKKTIYISIILGGIILFMLNTIIYNFTGFSMDHVLNTARSRIQRTGDSESMQWFIQFLSSFIGPFPNFTRTAEYGIYHNSGLLLKCFLNFFAYVGTYKILKNFDFRFYPIALYVFMGYLMLTISGVSLDMRYHVTFLSSLMILIANGLQRVSLKNYMFYIYSVICILIIISYNIR